jgi:uncharacterized circularly permuted ATP-grasp superfamily protein
MIWQASGGTSTYSGRENEADTPAAPYNEFYLDDFEPRGHYRPLWEHIRRVGQNVLGNKVLEADLALRTEGVTFTVHDDNNEGIERVWPFDLIPRVIPAAEWQTIESGLKQRVRALNLFLHDIYHEQRVLKDGVLPAKLIFDGKDYRREICGIDRRAASTPHLGDRSDPRRTALPGAQTTCARRPACRT